MLGRGKIFLKNILNSKKDRLSDKYYSNKPRMASYCSSLSFGVLVGTGASVAASFDTTSVPISMACARRLG